MKWRDAVKAAIMHGPLPPDVWYAAVASAAEAQTRRRRQSPRSEHTGPDTFRRWHDSGAPDHRGRPLADLPHSPAARLSLSVPTWLPCAARARHRI